ncbi:MAG TPA: DnaJ domain-containing protein [Desertimonas sp.]|nr:DnaJ domain-containing protein [Desertimonas sp.]
MVSLDDARRLLGVSPDAGVEDVRAARRRLAKRCHPDVAGGDTETMRQLNEAASIVLHELGVVTEDTESPIDAAARRRWPAPRRPPTGARVDHDVASFVIEALPAVAFEALLVVTSWIGEVVVDEPPYQLDVLLLDPLRCWCRLDLVPDAGASTVSLTIAALPDEALPDIDDVRDLWVASLNRLGR